MRIAKPLLVSAIVAAAVVAGMAWYISYQAADSFSQPPGPTLPPSPSQVEPDGARLMPPTAGMQLYLNAERDFYFSYPNGAEAIEDTERMATLGYIPVCDPERAIVCVPIGQKTYEGTNFGAAAFSVRILPDRTQGTCLAAHQNEVPAGEIENNESRYAVFGTGDAAMSHRLEGTVYRTFRDGTCFELAKAVATSVYEVYEPGTIREFTAADRAAVEAELDRMFRSFWFQDNIELL